MKEHILRKNGNELLYVAMAAEENPHTILFVYFTVVNLKFILKIYRFVPVKYASQPVSDTVPMFITRYIKQRVFEKQMEYIIKEDSKKRNPSCDFNNMCIHLYNSSAAMRMEKRYKGYFFTIRVPLFAITTLAHPLPPELIKYLNHQVNLFRVKLKEDVQMVIGEDLETAVKSRAEFSLFNIQDDVIELFTNIQKETLYYNPENGDLQETPLVCDVGDCSKLEGSNTELTRVASTAVQLDGTAAVQSSSNGPIMKNGLCEHFIDLKAFFGLKLQRIDPKHLEYVQNIIVTEMKENMKKAFNGPLLKIFLSSPYRLDGPLPFNSLSRALPLCFCTKSSKHVGYYLELMNCLKQNGQTGSVLIPYIQSEYPSSICLKGYKAHQLNHQLLVLKASQGNVIFQFIDDDLDEVYVSGENIRGGEEEVLSRGFLKLMSSMWAGLSFDLHSVPPN
jgi:hypothetical protein